MTQICGGLWLALLIVPGSSLLGQTSTGTSGEPSAWHSSLPVPTGAFAVGRITVHWIDTTRIEPLSPDHDYRDLMVDVWYPADPSPGATAPYLDSATFEHVLCAAGFRDQFRGASDAILAGVKTHAVLGAPFAGSAKGVARRSPLLIFSPGGGMIREVYTSQMQDEDIRFVAHQLIAASKDPSSELPFARYIDPSRIGAFGHSFGGIAAGHACQMDRRLKACLDEDGVVAKQPFYLDDRGWGMDQAYMLLERASSKSLPSEKS